MSEHIEPGERIEPAAMALAQRLYVTLFNDGFGWVWDRFQQRAVYRGVVFEQSQDGAGPVLVFTPYGELVVRDLLATLEQRDMTRLHRAVQIERTLMLAGYTPAESRGEYR